MDFLENVGQRYLERKAYAVPQQLENLVKKQLSPATDQEKQAKQALASLPAASNKDRGIAHLRQQLAEAKVSKQTLPPRVDPAATPRNSIEAVEESDAANRRSSIAAANHMNSTHSKPRERRHSIANPHNAAYPHAPKANAPPRRRPSSDRHRDPHQTSTKPVGSPRRPAHHEVKKAQPVLVETASLARHQRLDGTRKSDVYTIQVEEEVSNRRRAPSKDVIEVSSDHGRTLYRVK